MKTPIQPAALMPGSDLTENIHAPARLKIRVCRRPASLGGAHYYLEAGEPVAIYYINTAHAQASCYAGQPDESTPKISEDFFTVSLHDLEFDPAILPERLDWRAMDRSVRFLDVAICDMIYDADGKAEERAAQIAGFMRDASRPTFAPTLSTLDHFRALIEIAGQLAEAANIPDSLRQRCATVCENAGQAIKRDTLFIQSVGRLHRGPGRPILGPAFTTTAEQPIQPGDDERRA